MKLCINCKIDITNTHGNTKYCNICKEKINHYEKYGKKCYEQKKNNWKLIRKKWQEDNKEKMTQYHKDRYIAIDKKRLANHYENNKEKINERHKEYRKNPDFIKKEKERRLKNSWKTRYRSSLRYVILRLNRNKLDHTNNLLGYSDLEFKIHIESKFIGGMSWINKKSFQIDHIIPIIGFKKNTPLCVICALDNLQPLSRISNINKFTSVDIKYLDLYNKYLDYLTDEFKEKISLING